MTILISQVNWHVLEEVVRSPDWTEELYIKEYLMEKTHGPDRQAKSEVKTTSKRNRGISSQMQAQTTNDPNN